MKSGDYVVGVDLGTTYTCAAVASATQSAAVVQLASNSQTIPSVVSLTDSAVLAGEAAERRLVSHPADTAREFKRRFGDPAPMVLGGNVVGADALTGHLLAEVINRVEQSEGSRPSTVVLTHPAAWGPFRVGMLNDAANEVFDGDVQLVPEPVAAAIANRDRVDDGSLIAVYDLGGGTFDAALVSTEDDWSVVGTPEGVERLGGVDFDQAILSLVDDVLDGQVFALDTSDPESRSALMALRAECQAAKEHLSQDTDVDIVVSLPTVHTSVRLTRHEFEAMVQPRLADSLAVFDRVVSSAGVSWDDVSAVLMVGGSSNIPIVAQMVSQHTGRPMVTATNPHMAIALGAAQMGADAASRKAASSVATASAVESPPENSEPIAVPVAAKSGSKTKLIAAGVAAAVVAAVALFFLLGSSGDSEQGSDQIVAADPTPLPTAAEPTEAPAVEPTEAAVVEATEAPDSAEAASSEQDTEPAAPLVAMQRCGDDLAGVLDLAVTDKRLFAVTADALLEYESASYEPCAVGSASDRTAQSGVTAPFGSAIGLDTGIAFSSPANGQVLNLRNQLVVPCPELGGPTAASDRIVYTIDGGAVYRITLNNTGCDAELAAGFEGIEATTLGADPTHVVVGGTNVASGELEVWFADDATTTVINEFGSIDTVGACGDFWCVADLDAGVLHYLRADGSDRTAAALNESMQGGGVTGLVTNVRRIVNTDQGMALALVDTDQGETLVVAITP